MYKNLFNWLTILLVLPACTHTPPDISVVCEENAAGDCIIKWETTPTLKGEVKVYASTSPSVIVERAPIATTQISNGRMKLVPCDRTKRYYYLMVFNDKYPIKVATRNINVSGIQNLRDLGGYRSFETKRNLRWGMIYRSAQIDSITPSSEKKLRNMGVKTIIDLRSEEEYHNCTQPHDGFNIIHVPIQTGNMEEILQKIREEKIKADTIYKLIEQKNRELVVKYQKEFKKIFQTLLNPNHYPIIIHCTSGKGRTGVVSALVLAAVGVNEDDIMADYRLSNDYFNIPKYSKYAYKLPADSQEAITTIYSAKEDFLNAAKTQIEAKYGDVNTYIKKGIGLSEEEIERLRDLLLE